jgi:hypothetical protein
MPAENMRLPPSRSSTSVPHSRMQTAFFLSRSNNMLAPTSCGFALYRQAGLHSVGLRRDPSPWPSVYRSAKIPAPTHTPMLFRTNSVTADSGMQTYWLFSRKLPSEQLGVVRSQQPGTLAMWMARRTRYMSVLRACIHPSDAFVFWKFT